MYTNCSTNNKTYFCTRCLTHFNYERYLKQHFDKCPNMVKEGNLIDSLKITGGYYKEIRRRFITKQLSYKKKFEAELSETTQADPKN